MDSSIRMLIAHLTVSSAWCSGLVLAPLDRRSSVSIDLLSAYTVYRRVYRVPGFLVKVHKTEHFFGSDFEICTFLLLVRQIY